MGLAPFDSTPLYGNWYRYGTIPDGNCFFHAYAFSIDPGIQYLDRPTLLQHIHDIKLKFANRITFMDASDLIDMSSFDDLVQSINVFLLQHNLGLPDLSKEPLFSIGDYVSLLCYMYPLLRTDPSFHQHVIPILNKYHHSIQTFVTTNGAWMFDSLIGLFMKKMEINIVLISHATQKPITHYPFVDYPSIFMYHISDHFESIGRIEEKSVRFIFGHPQFP